jgi:transposase
VTYIAERDGPAGEIAKRLVLIAHAVLRVEHRREKQPRAARNDQRRINRLRRSWQATLQKGTNESMPKRTRNIGRRLLADNDMLWTFTGREDVPLTHNKAEQALRPYVIWRKSSYSAQSAQGDQFRPQILTVLQTAKRWNLSSLKLLREICTQAIETGRVDFRFPFASELPSK